MPITDSLKPLRVVPARLRQQVAGDVFADELIVRHVVIEGADQIIAITPGVMDLVVPFVAVRLGEADDVHPVPGPAFAEMGRGQQPIDQLRDGRMTPRLLLALRDEPGDLARRRAADR